MMKAYPRYALHGPTWAAIVPEHWTTVPLWTVLSESKVRNTGLAETNLLSLSYGRIVRKDIDAVGGLLPESFETYQIVEADSLVFRFTDLQNDQRSLRTARTPERGIITSAYASARPVGIAPKYAEYLMRAYDTLKVFYGLGGGVRQSLKFADVARLPVLLPPEPEQRAIADYLDRETVRIDTLIEEQQRLIEMLRERRASEIAAGFAGPAKTPLRQAIEYAQTGPFGTQLTADEYIDGGVPVINPTHIRGGRIAPDDSTTVTPEKAEELVRYRLAVGDIVLGRKGEVDKSALVNEQSDGYLCGSDSMALRPRLGAVPDYLWWFLQSFEAHSQLDFWSVGATVSGLNQTTIRKVRLPLPDVQEQRRVASYLSEKTEKIDILIGETERFIELARERRVALITAAVTGQIDVREMA